MSTALSYLFGSSTVTSCSTQSVALRPIILSGPESFYNQPDYLEATQRELAQKEPLPPSGVYDVQTIIPRIAQRALSCLFFPFTYLHTAYGNQLFAPTAAAIHAEQARPLIDLSSEWKYRRFTLLVSGEPVDAIMVGRPTTLDNGRWMLISMGITMVYEALLIAQPEQAGLDNCPGLAPLQRLLTQINANAVFYNYPGMGASAGRLSLRSIKNAHEAFLQFVEDLPNVHAIIDKGHSFGGGVQAAAWERHIAKKDIRYVLVKDRAAMTIREAVTNIAGRCAGIAGTILGWNINAAMSSDRVKFPEIHVMSVRNIRQPQRFTDPSQIAQSGDDPSIPTYNDLLIPSHTSTAIHYLRPRSCVGPKTIIGVPEPHGASIVDPTVLADAINEGLDSQGRVSQ